MRGRICVCVCVMYANIAIIIYVTLIKNEIKIISLLSFVKTNFYLFLIY